MPPPRRMTTTHTDSRGSIPHDPQGRSRGDRHAPGRTARRRAGSPSRAAGCSLSPIGWTATRAGGYSVWIALADPAGRDAADLVAAFSAAGVRTVMITGDHPATAHSIAAEIGIAD